MNFIQRGGPKLGKAVSGALPVIRRPLLPGFTPSPLAAGSARRPLARSIASAVGAGIPAAAGGATSVSASLPRLPGAASALLQEGKGAAEDASAGSREGKRSEGAADDQRERAEEKRRAESESRGRFDPAAAAMLGGVMIGIELGRKAKAAEEKTLKANATAHVFVWPNKAGNVGHMAVLVINEETGEKFYSSHWPTDAHGVFLEIPMASWFTPWDSKQQTMIEDIGKEAQLPSEVLTLKGLDFNEMKAEAEAVSQKGYQFLAGSLASVGGGQTVSSDPVYLASEDPFMGAPVVKSAPREGTNCTVSTLGILIAGGGMRAFLPAYLSTYLPVMQFPAITAATLQGSVHDAEKVVDPERITGILALSGISREDIRTALAAAEEKEREASKETSVPRGAAPSPTASGS